MDNNLQEAITLIKSGKKKEGGQILSEIVKKEPRNIDAWLWLTSCVNSNEQRIFCLKKVLEIDPNHNMARSALSKLQQPEQPSEQEILGTSGVSQQPASNTQPRKVASPIPNVPEKKSAFQPKYLTALGGMGIMIGTVFPWAAMVSGQYKLDEYSGFTVAPGILTAIVGLAIIFIAIFQHTKPGKANSLISSLFALVTFLMACLWATAFYPICDEAFFNPDATCYRIGTGFGYGLSMFSLFLTFIVGLIPNPKN